MKKWITLLVTIFCFFIASGFGSPPQKESSGNPNKTSIYHPYVRNVKMPSLAENNVYSTADCAYVLAKKINSSYQKNLALSKIAASYIGLGERDKALYIFDLMTKKSDRLKALTEMATRYVQEDELDQAIKMTDYLETESQKNFLFEYIVLALINEDKLQQASNIFHRIRSPFLKDRLASKLAEKYSDANLFDEALEITKEISKHITRSNTLSYIARKMSSEGYNDIAFANIKKIQNEEIQKKAYLDMVDSLIEKNKLETANEIGVFLNDSAVYNSILLKIIKKYAQQKDLTNLKIYSELITGEENIEKAKAIFTLYLANVGKTDKALRIIDSLQSRELRNNSYIDIAKILSQEEQTDEAFEIIDKILDPHKHAEGLIKVAGSLGASKNKQIYYNRLIIKQLKPEKIQELAFVEYALNYAKKGSFEKIIQIINEIRDSELRNKTLSDIAQINAKKKSYENIIDYLLLISDSRYKTRKLIDFAYLFKKEKQDHLIFTALFNAYNNAKTIDKPYAKVKLLLEISESYLELNKNAKVREILALASESSGEIKNLNERNNFIEKIILQYVKADYRMKALYLIKLLNTPFQKAKILAILPNKSSTSQLKANYNERNILLEIARTH